MDESKEVLDLVDGNDQVIGTILRGDVMQLFQTSGKYIRYANCLIIRKDGQLWVPRRAANKKIAPNGLDFAASEHVKSGESYGAAVVRGISEELNLQVTSSDLQEIGKLQPDKGRPYFSTIYLCTLESAPEYNREDFTGYVWVSVQELEQRLVSGEPAKDDLLPAIKLLNSL